MPHIPREAPQKSNGRDTIVLEENSVIPMMFHVSKYSSSLHLLSHILAAGRHRAKPQLPQLLTH